MSFDLLDYNWFAYSMRKEGDFKRDGISDITFQLQYHWDYFK